MNAEETLELLWNTEERLAKGAPADGRTLYQLTRGLGRMHEGTLRVALARRFETLNREQPAPTERFRWADRERVHRPASLAAALKVLREHDCTPIGRGHAGTPSEGHLLDLAALDQVERVTDAHVGVDAERFVRAQAGITLHALVQALEPDDLVPAHLGGALTQSLAGAIHTGAHGPGGRPLADAVRSVDVFLDGSIQRFEPSNGITDPLRCPYPLTQDDAAFAAMVVNRGQIGVSAAFTLRVEDLAFVQETTSTRSLDQLRPLLKTLKKAPTDEPVPERIALTVRADAVWVHRYRTCRRSQIPQQNWSGQALEERRFLAPLEDAVGERLLGWVVDLCPHLTAALIAREKHPRSRIGRSWELTRSPSTPAWRTTRETCALDDLIDRLQHLREALPHPIRVVFAEPSERHALLPGVRTATIEIRTPPHVAAPQLLAATPPPASFEAQRELRTDAADPSPEALVLKALQGSDLPADQARRLQALMTDGKRFAEVFASTRPRAAAARSGGNWEDWLGGNKRHVQKRNPKNLPELLQVLEERRHEFVRTHGKRHADNWVSAPPDGAFSLNLMDDWKHPPKDELTTYQHQGKTFARALGWERLGNFFDRLEEAKLAIVNTGSFSGQSIGGPLSVATHGSGAAFGAMADGVVEIDILCADGKVRRIKRDDWPTSWAPVLLPHNLGVYTPEYIDIPFELAVVNLGCFGIVLSYVLQVEAPYRLQQKTSLHALEDGLAHAEVLNADPNVRHVELVMVPNPIELNVEDEAGNKQKKPCQVVLIQRSIPPDSVKNTRRPGLPFPANLVRYLGHEGQSAVGHMVQNVKLIRQQMLRGALTSQKPFVHGWRGVLIRDSGVMAHSFEIHVPVGKALQAAEAVNDGINAAAAQGVHPSAPVGVRFVKAGTQAMAMNNEDFAGGPGGAEVQLWCTFEVPRLLGSSNPALIVDLILERLDAQNIPFRPHWGQYFPEDLPVAARYPRLDEWLQARQQLDPTGAFFPPKLKARLSPTRSGTSVSEAAAFEGQASRKALVVLPSHAAPGGPWQAAFEGALVRALQTRRLPMPQLVYLRTDDLFADRLPTGARVRQAMLDTFGAGTRYHLDRRRGQLASLPEDPEWQPAHVAAWLQDAELREQLRIRIYNAVVQHRPEVVIAHGSATLPLYDTVTHSGFAPRQPFDLVTLASPVAHLGLRSCWGGALPRPSRVRNWFSAHHRSDPFFVGPIARHGVYDVELRERTEHPHGVDTHVQATAVVRDIWNVVFGDATPQQRTRLDARRHRRRARKALLVGIDTYLDPAFSDLQGSVNDVLAMSELLQSQYGYRAEDIRILTDKRATADALRDRLEWLLAGTTSLDQRVFYFSGHGTQLPAYNAVEVVDRVDECLVTHDFDWNATDRAFVDDDFMELYSQLPHGARFTAIFDCCHAAGMSRAGGGQVRGVGLPEDVLHRMRRFVDGQWTFRPTQPRREAVRKRARNLASGTLGAANGLRSRLHTADADPAVRGYGGPFLPVLLYATQEQDLAYEYRDGRQVRGAFSWALTQALERDPNPTFHDLFASVTEDLKRAVGSQRPDLEGPSARLNADEGPLRGIFDL